MENKHAVRFSLLLLEENNW